MTRHLFLLLSACTTLAVIGCASDGGDDAGPQETGGSFDTVDTSNPNDMPTEANVDTSVSSYTPSTADTANMATRTYTVQTGDSLWKIAKNNGTSVGIIKALNNLTSDVVQVGQTLKLPAN